MKATDYDMVGQAKLVRSGAVGPTELVRLTIEAIEELDPSLSAVTQKMYDHAIARAEYLAGSEAPFAGVPIILKDHGIEQAGEPYSWGGIRFLIDMNWKSHRDTNAGASLRRAGFVSVARSTTSLMGLLLPTHDRAMHDMPRNPWNTDYSTGGSSSGSAVAVAARMVAVAHGGDSGGSIRLPASFCGVVGLKPTRGRVSQGPRQTEVMSTLNSWLADFVLTRSVRDSIAMLGVMSGWHPGDSIPSGRPHVGQRPPLEPESRRLRVGVTATPFAAGFTSDPECLAAVSQTASLLGDLGHDVEFVNPPRYDWNAMDWEYGARAKASYVRLARTLDRLGQEIGRPVTERDVGPQIWTCVELGRGYSAMQMLEAAEAVQTIVTKWDRWWLDQGIDVLVSPTVPSLPPPMTRYVPHPDGEFQFKPEDPLAGLDLTAPLIAFTHIYNLTGQPALSLPLAVSANGLPIGIQFGAAQGRDDLLLRLGLDLEEAQPWDMRRPAVCA